MECTPSRCDLLHLIRGSTTRSSALRADERARVESSFEFSALRAVELSFERHPFGATSSSRTRVPAAHHDGWNLAVPPPGGRSAPCGMTLNSRPLDIARPSGSIII